ncbi:MAG: hypothetical protein ACREH4_13385 [Vitreimonas sp.]
MIDYNTMLLAVLRGGGRFSPRLGWIVGQRRFPTLQAAFAFVTRRT